MSAVTATLASANDLLAYHSTLLNSIRKSQFEHRRQIEQLPSSITQSLLDLPLLHPSTPSPPSSPVLPPVLPPKPSPRRDLPPAKLARAARYTNYVPEEETIRNDYSQRYVDGGEWPQDWVIGAEPEHRFEEYPKQHRLLSLKKQSVQDHSLPPLYLPFSSLSSLHPSKFDVILIDPPFSSTFTWSHLQDLPIPSLAADPSFAFLWVGSGAGEGLERGREVLAKWGYRRCEDVVWVRTNRTTNKGPGTDPPTTSLLTRTKQHCLIGIRGTVRRSTDSWFVHCNVDTDVIIWEGDPLDPTRKPPEMYTLIENFCLGTRRLEVFGKLGSSLRRGWVTATAGDSVPDGPINVDGAEGGLATRFHRERWDADIKALANGGKCVVPMTADIDNLRPKSPVRGQSTNNGGGTGGGGGSSGGVVLSTAGSNVGPRFANPGMRNYGGMDMNPMGMPIGVNAMGMGNMAGMEGMMGGAWPGMMGMGGMDPQSMMGMGGMNGQMMDPQAQAMAMSTPMTGMMMGGQGGFPAMMNGMGQMGQSLGWGDGQLGMDSNMMAGMGGMGMGQWTGY